MERYKANAKRDILRVESEPYVIENYRGYGLALIVRKLATNEEYEFAIDGIKSIFVQMEPLVELNGAKFTGLEFGIKKASSERSSPYVIDTRISEPDSDTIAEDPTSPEDRLWRNISNRHGT